ncbi:Carboxylic ester hydrolase, partial [Gryllus bimaculatus]
PLVHLETGAVQGVYASSTAGRKFSAFRGIPYARPPTGKYRFKHQVLKCFNVYFQLFTMDSSPPREVLVFIHGKTFMSATELKHDPSHLMDNNIVVVTFNYRLGILGFLSTEDDVAPGNFGMKDQVLALHWIQKNIAAFGGNPMRVIIAGSLAGGASVHYHYFSSNSQGLFHGGMSFAGTALSPWAQAYKPRVQTNKLAEILGCSTYSSGDLIDCLRYRPARKIMQQTKHFLFLYFSKEIGTIPTSPFGPTIETMGKTPFINRHPGESLLAGAIQDLPWVTSTTIGNGFDPLSVSESAFQFLNENFHNIASIVLNFNHTVAPTMHRKISENIYQQYIANASTPEAALLGYQQLLIDRMYTADAERAARMMASINSAPVYFYDIPNKSLKDKLASLQNDVPENPGIVIRNEIEYVEPTLYAREYFEEGRSLFKFLTKVFVNFVQTGNPTPSIGGGEWLPLIPNYKEINYLCISSSTAVEMKSSLELGNRKFWDSLPLQDPSSIAFKVKMFSHSSEL